MMFMANGCQVAADGLAVFPNRFFMLSPRRQVRQGNISFFFSLRLRAFARENVFFLCPQILLTSHFLYVDRLLFYLCALRVSAVISGIIIHRGAAEAAEV